MDMTRSILILHAATDLATQLGPAAAYYYAAFLRDTLALVGNLNDVRLLSCTLPGSRQIAEAGIALGDQEPIGLQEALASALAAGPTLLLGGDLPHLPLWRLRDALTYLDDDADLVLGPCEHGGWYLLGLRAANPALLQVLTDRNTATESLLAVATAHGLRTVRLPGWYALSNLADLERLAADLRTMPSETASHTRAILGETRARAVGG